MRKILPVIAALGMALLVSCVHESPFGEEEMYIEAFGDPSEIVVTLDAERAKEHLPVADNAITARTGRMNIALSPKVTDTYPLPAGDYRVRGALEGNFGSVEVSAAMLFTDGMEKVKEGKDRFWTDGRLEFGVPEAGILLFSDSSYPELKRESITERTLKIPHETAAMMAEAMAGFYVYSPETLLDLGFDLPLSVLLEMDHALFRIDLEEEQWHMSADVMMKSEKSAKSFTQIIKNQTIGELKRAGIKPDFKALSEMIWQDGMMSRIVEKPLTEEQVLAFYQKISGMSGGLF